MLIVCPNCTTSYQVKSEAFGQSGRKVRCARCRREWFATPSAIPPAPGQMPTVASPPTQAVATEREEGIAALAAPSVAPDAEPPSEAAEPTSSPDHADPPSPTEAAVEAAAEPAPEPELPARPAAADAAETSASAGTGTDIETVAARRYGTVGRALRRPLPLLARLRGRTGQIFALPLLPTIIAAQLLAIGTVVGWRNDVVRAMPPAASLFRLIGLSVNLRGLAFADLRATPEAQDGVAVLVIEGTIENVTGSTVIVPRLRFALRNGARAELMSWTAPPEQPTLGAGEALAFRSRLAAPPANGSDVLVRFFTRADLSNGAR
jgi:predicted Zn finger-like uncharacterized protein